MQRSRRSLLLTLDLSSLWPVVGLLRTSAGGFCAVIRLSFFDCVRRITVIYRCQCSRLVGVGEWLWIDTGW